MVFVVKRVSGILLLILCLVKHICGLNVGPLSTADHNSTITISTPCSRTCESDHCTLPPLLRYGKYCGLLYSGCPGEKPCDELDECCMVHDNCVQSNHDYLNVECNQNFLDCIIAFRDSGRPSFGGSRCVVVEVVDVISVVIEAAIIAGKIHH